MLITPRREHHHGQRARPRTPDERNALQKGTSIAHRCRSALAAASQSTKCAIYSPAGVLGIADVGGNDSEMEQGTGGCIDRTPYAPSASQGIACGKHKGCKHPAASCSPSRSPATGKTRIESGPSDIPLEWAACHRGVGMSAFLQALHYGSPSALLFGRKIKC